MTELFQLLEGHRFRYVPGLRIPWNKISKILAGGGLCDAGMPSEVDHEAILAADFAWKKIDERLLQSPGSGLFIVEFDDFFESQLMQRLGDRFGIFDGAGNFRRQQVIFNPNDYAPGLVIKPFRLSNLRIGRRKPETSADQNGEKT